MTIRFLRSLGLALTAACLSLQAWAQAPQPPEIAARSYLLLDLTSNQVLAERNADAPAEPASLTKLMTAYLTFVALRDKKLTLETRLPVSERTETLTRRAYLQVILTIVNGIRARQHGGALIVAANGSKVLDPGRAWVRPTYPVVAQASYLADHVLTSVQARLMVEASTRARMSEMLDMELRTSTLRLMEAANFVANLSGTDGATVLRSDLTLVGFGVEIAVKPRTSSPVFEIIGDSLELTRPLDSQQFGMRRRRHANHSLRR